jgi:muramidase (phage lysozyme)
MKIEAVYLSEPVPYWVMAHVHNTEDLSRHPQKHIQ